MSSSRDAGYHAEQAGKAVDEKCPQGGKHKWVRYGSYPSIYDECVKCEKTIYWK